MHVKVSVPRRDLSVRNDYRFAFTAVEYSATPTRFVDRRWQKTQQQLLSICASLDVEWSRSGTAGDRVNLTPLCSMLHVGISRHTLFCNSLAYLLGLLKKFLGVVLNGMDFSGRLQPKPQFYAEADL